MRRHNGLFKKITDIENLHRAYLNARKGKTWQRQVKEFDKNAGSNLLEIQASLIDKTYTTSQYKEKTIFEPKKRLIYILPFTPDRIVQHALMNVVEPIWEGLFIGDSYACRKGKGIHAGRPALHKKFSDFAKEATPLDGSKLKIDDVLNREILVTGCKLRSSRFGKENSPQCLTLQFEIDGQKHIVFTGSSVLIEQMDKYQAEIPFLTVIKKIDKYYTFS